MNNSINYSDNSLGSKIDITIYCQCGLPLNINGVCTRKYPVKACKERNGYQEK